MAAILACLALILFQGAQAPKPASIEGDVRRVGTGEPVAKARIVLAGGPQTTPPASRQNAPKSVTTDRSGHFVFANLPAGRYNLTAFANGYVRMGYGQKAQNLPGTPIMLQAGEEVKDILFEMDPTGTISGRIYDFDNLPLPSADVTLQKSAYDAGGQRTLQTVQQARTNDLGEYRLFWISPGKYFLRVDYSGAPTPLSRNPNEYIGPVTDGYAAMYYPGTADPAQAIEIDVLPGTEMGAIDLTLLRTKTVTVRGRVIVNVPNMSSARPSVSLRPRQPVGPTLLGSTNTSMQPDGTFEIRGVVPGAYTLTANVGTAIADRFTAEKNIEINDDTEGLTIVISPGFDLPFRIIYEGQPPGSSTGSQPAMRPVLRTFGDSSGRIVGSGISSILNPPTIKADGTFTLPNIPPGTYQIQLLPLPADDYIKAVTFAQSDGLREGFTVDRTPDSPIEILISTNGGSLKGKIVDKDGNHVASTRVFLIPTDRSRSERFKAAASDVNGSFQIRGIYPGEYKLFAWDLIETNAERDPEFIRKYEEQGKRVVVTEGANSDVDVRLIKVQP
jgi:hypothetical protein